MLKHTLAALAAMVAFFGVTIQITDANATEFYGKVQVGQATNTEAEGFALSDDLTYGAEVGADFGVLRVGAGVQRITADTAGLNASATAYGVTAYYDVPVSERGAFFAGAGVDYVEAEIGFGPFSIDGEGAGWHVGGGYSHKLTESVTFEVSYTHLQADLDFGFGDNLSASSDLAQVGIRFAL